MSNPERVADAHGLPAVYCDHDVDAEQPLITETDATLIIEHSKKEHAAPTFERGFGFRPLWAFRDNGAEGTGEPLTCLLRKGNAL